MPVARAPRVDEVAIRLVTAEEQSADPAPRTFRIRPADDHELLAVQAFSP
jgi:hypothetical protein